MCGMFPYMMRILNKASFASSVDMTSVRGITSGGGLISKETQLEFMKLFPNLVHMRHGLYNNIIVNFQ